MKVIASTIWVLRRMAQLHPACKTLVTAPLLVPAQCGIGSHASVLLKLIMQGFEADAENLCGPGLIIAGRRQSLQNK